VGGIAEGSEECIEFEFRILRDEAAFGEDASASKAVFRNSNETALDGVAIFREVCEAFEDECLAGKILDQWDW
jgi:hypothetical protein